MRSISVHDGKRDEDKFRNDAIKEYDREVYSHYQTVKLKEFWRCKPGTDCAGLIFFDMRYYTEKSKNVAPHSRYFTKLNHPLYNSCCLFETKEGTGLAIVQRYFNPKLKVYWYGAVESWIMDEVVAHDDFLPYIYKNSEEAILGVYPTVTVRQVMYALKMKPLKKEWWESQNLQPL